MRPETKYAKSGDVHIAYQVIGQGNIDLVLVPGFVSHVECTWEEPSYARFLDRLSSFCRVILFDKRGTGMSDPVPVQELPTLEERMDDVRAVMDAAGSQRAALFGWSEGGAMSILFAATYPERTSALVGSGPPRRSSPSRATRAFQGRSSSGYSRSWRKTGTRGSCSSGSLRPSPRIGAFASGGRDGSGWAPVRVRRSRCCEWKRRRTFAESCPR